MNIYSIKEILKATNNFLDSVDDKKTNKITKKFSGKIPVNTQKIINEAEMALASKKINLEEPLILKDEISTKSKINQFNYKIKIKDEVKDHMVNELFIYLKKKLKKNTLKLILEEQLIKKNLENKINFLKEKENNLTINYQILKNNYESVLDDNKLLKINNKDLQENLDKIKITNKNLNTENEELKINLQESLQKNRSYEINNSELKKTISRYIENYKKLQEKINLLENSKNLQSEDQIKKVKFYQDENIRLSSELLLARKKNDTIKENLNNIELEKEKISNKIKELNNSIKNKSNVISPNITKEALVETKKDIKKLDDKENKNLDEVINRIFSKI